MKPLGQLLHDWDRSCPYLITSTAPSKFTIGFVATPERSASLPLIALLLSYFQSPTFLISPHPVAARLVVAIFPRPQGPSARALTVLAARPVRLSHRKSVMAAALRPESRHPRGDEVRLHPPTRGPGTSRPVPGLCSSPARPGSVPAPRIRSAPLAPPPPGARSQLGLRLWPLRSAAAAVSERARTHVRTHVLRHFPGSDGLRPRTPGPFRSTPRLHRHPREPAKLWERLWFRVGWH